MPAKKKAAHFKHSIIPLSDLIPYVNNSRTHTDEQIMAVAASIKEFGFTNPVLIDDKGGIVAGHCRVDAARKLGLADVPCITLEGLTEAQRKAYVIADNQLTLHSGSGWDLDLLKLEVESLQEMDFETDLLGFDDDFMADLLAETTEGLTDEDDVPEPPEEPITQRGDVWQLGNHRLMCGDSTSADDVGVLMGGAKIDLLHTDPPYGIEETGDRRKRTGENSLAKGVKYKDFDDSTVQIAIDAFNLVDGLKIARQVWWGANYYAHHVPQTANWFVWDKRVEEKQKDMNSDCELAWVKSQYSSVRIFRHLWKGLIKESEHGQARVHPTQKPIALVEWVFGYYKNIDTVLDLFGGSGSTMIAAEKQGKKSFLMELEPYYCDVIIKRWENFTGKKAERISHATPQE